jgi:hypothetical protein
MPELWPPPAEREKQARWIAAWKPWALPLAVALAVLGLVAILWSSFEIIEALQ